jgi:formyl-CoA transferase
MGHVFLNLNRNKRSLSADLKQAEAASVVGAGAERRSDAQYAAAGGGPARFSWERLCQVNPRLVYCSAQGYGQDGPLADRPAFDDIIRAPPVS